MGAAVCRSDLVAEGIGVFVAVGIDELESDIDADAVGGAAETDDRRKGSLVVMEIFDEGL